MDTLARDLRMSLYRVSVKEDLNVANVFLHLAENFVTRVHNANNFLAFFHGNNRFLKGSVNSEESTSSSLSLSESSSASSAASASPPMSLGHPAAIGECFQFKEPKIYEFLVLFFIFYDRDFINFVFIILLINCSCSHPISLGNYPINSFVVLFIYA